MTEDDKAWFSGFVKSQTPDRPRAVGHNGRTIHAHNQPLYASKMLCISFDATGSTM
jgi:hypothetical protein